jgi:hypothetical protein
MLLWWRMKRPNSKSSTKRSCIVAHTVRGFGLWIPCCQTRPEISSDTTVGDHESPRWHGAATLGQESTALHLDFALDRGSLMSNQHVSCVFCLTSMYSLQAKLVVLPSHCLFRNWIRACVLRVTLTLLQRRYPNEGLETPRLVKGFLVHTSRPKNDLGKREVRRADANEGGGFILALNSADTRQRRHDTTYVPSLSTPL